MNPYIIYPLLIAQLIAVGFFIIRTYITGYYSEKGKGLATKQDIGEITNKIEEVRIDYNSKLESTKAAIQLDLFYNQQFFQKSTEILLRFYDTLVVLSYDNLSNNLGDFPISELAKSLTEYQDDTIRKFNSLLVDYHRLLVFMDGKEKIMDDCATMLELAMSLKEIFSKYIFRRKSAILNESKIGMSPEEYEDAVLMTNNINKKYHQALNPVKEKFNKEIGVFISTLMDYFKQKNLV